MKPLEILLSKRWILKDREKELYYQLKDDNIDVQFLKTISKQDCIFPEIDYMLYF